MFSYFGVRRNIIFATVHRRPEFAGNARRVAGEQLRQFYGFSAHEHDLIAQIFVQTVHVGPKPSLQSFGENRPVRFTRRIV